MNDILFRKGTGTTHTTRERHLDTGDRPVVVEERLFAWPGLELKTSTQDISRSVDWKISKPHHSVIVHLGGRMDQLETEFDGRGGVSGPATPGEVWTVPAHVSYASHAKGETIRFAVLSLPSESESKELGGIATASTLVITTGVHDAALTGVVERLIRLAIQPDDLSQLQAESLAHSIPRHIYQVYGASDPSRLCKPEAAPVLSSAEARLLREFIYDHLESSMSLEALAGLASMTKHQLLIAFRASFGTTPTQYIITQRLRRARWYLLHSHLDITSIALACGFNSHSHLTSAFTKRFGHPPQTFRERHVKIGAG